MAQLSVIFLISLHSSMILTIASESNAAESSSSSTRKLGKHNVKLVKFYADAPHDLSPSESPQVKDKHSHSKKEINLSPQSALMEEIHMNKGHHKNGSGNNSAAGGEVILGGLATTFLIAIFCYIRATRTNNARLLQSGSP